MSMYSAGDSRGIARCPPEILLNVCYFLAATDVFHLRRVSKQFRELSCDIGLWKYLYANARVPRPPGPFLWQTYDVLQNILLQSERLDRTWTSQPCKVVRTSDLFFLDWTHVRSRVFQHDRVWFVRKSELGDYELLCYSFKTESLSVMWRWDRPALIKVCLDVSVEGPAVFIFAMDKMFGKLLKCRVDSNHEVLPVSASWDVTSLEGGREEPITFFSRASTVYLGGHIPLVFDAISCRFYQVPIHSGPRALRRFTPYFLRRTQLLWIDSHEDADFELRFRVFSLPESRAGCFLSDSASISELRLTHVMVVPQKPSCSISSLVLPPPLCPATQPTQFKLLMLPWPSGFDGTSTYECLTIALPGTSPLPSSSDVLSFSMQAQTLFTVDEPGCVLYASEDGHARGLWEGRSDTYRKFSIDASGDVCRAMVGDWTDVYFEHDSLIMDEVDCLRGKACCRRSIGSGEELVIVDVE